MLQVFVTLSRLANKYFAVLVVFAGIAGFVIPETCKLAAPYISILLGVVMFGMGLTLSPADFREVFRRPRDVAIGIVGQFVIMPVSAWVLCIVMDLPSEVAVGLMLLGCCPGGTASNVVTFLARGDVALSVTITSCTTLLAPVMTPALMYLFASEWLEVDPVAMFVSIVQIIVVPVAAGVFAHKWLGRKLDNIVAALPLVSVISIVTIAAAVVGGAQKQLVSAGLLVFAAVALHNAMGLGFGYLFAKMLGMNLSKRKCLSIEVGMQNSGLGAALATVHFAMNPMAALPSAIGALWHNITGPVLATVFAKMREEGEEPSFFDRIEALAAKQKAGDAPEAVQG